MAVKQPYAEIALPFNQRLCFSTDRDDWIGLVGLLLITLLALTIHLHADYRRWLVIPLMLVITVVQAQPVLNAPPRTKHGRVALLLGLMMLVIATGATPWALILFCFMFSGYVSTIFDSPTNNIWIGIFGVASAAVLLWYNDFGNAFANFTNALMPMLGYFFVGYAAQNSRRASAAEQESRRLLDELREAHAQLQAYADRVEALTLAEERNRLSREMHDMLGHRLTVAAVQLEGAQKLTARDPQRAAQMIETVRGQVVEGLGELRRTVAALREPTDDVAMQPSLVDALRELAQNFAQATNLELHLDLADNLPPLSTDQHQAFYRTAQESLTNIQRHAHASQAWLALNYQNGEAPPTVTLTVRDDGVGLSAGRADGQADGFGLRGLRERAARLGGTFRVESPPDAGVKSTFVVPISTSSFERKNLNAERR